MALWKDDALKQYKSEYFKQTMPYQYEIAIADKARGVLTSGPLVSALGNVTYFPDMSGNILDFRMVLSEYVIFINRNGLPEEDLVSRLLENANGADIVYPDEDFLDFYESDSENMPENISAKYFRTPWRKPDYSPDTLMSFPYIETCFAVRTAFAKTVPVPVNASELSDEVRIYDFLLRCTQKTDRIVHVPEILYHRFLPEELKEEKKEEGVTDSDIYNALYKKYNKAGYCLARDAAKSRLGYDTVPEPEDGNPLISVIIPSKDHSEMLRDCIEKVIDARDDLKIEIIVVDNGSAEDEKEKIESYLKGVKGIRTFYIYDPDEFNFSKMCNQGAAKAKGSFLLFLNDDVEADDSTFLKEMVKVASMPHVGAVGVKLLYPDWEKIQHVGVADINKGPTHKLATFDDREIHYFGRNRYAWDVLAVTGACLMVDREKYFNVGGFHDKMKVGYNDVDLCVKLYENGFYNIACCGITLIHHESVARGLDSESVFKMRRLRQERALLYELHPWLKEYGDPFFSKGLDQDTVSYDVALVSQFKETDYRNPCKAEPHLLCKPKDKVSLNVENYSYEAAIDENQPDAYVFEGWSLINKADNALYSRLLCFIPLTDDGQLCKEHLACKVSPKYREDVPMVFPEAVNAKLAGFVCRIPVDRLSVDVTYQLAMAEYTPGIRHKYLTLGDRFSIERGIHKSE